MQTIKSIIGLAFAVSLPAASVLVAEEIKLASVPQGAKKGEARRAAGPAQFHRSLGGQVS